MKHSIKRFLLFYLLLSITLTSSLTAIGNFFLDNHAIKKYFDSQIVQAAYFIRTLITSHPTKPYLDRLQHNISNLPKATAESGVNYMPEGLDHMQFRVWDLNGKLLLHTPMAPKISLNDNRIQYGFTSVKINNEDWRILKVPAHPHSKIIILIAERFNIRSDLINQLTWGNLFMLLWSYPLFALLIWLSVDRGLLSLRRLTQEIKKRQSTQLETVDISNSPIEVKPLVEALNKLFLRLEEAFERNRRFSADAAHELRTPLAALKTQAQVALKAPSAEDKRAGLTNVIAGVDRCTHIVQQLLTLSRLMPEGELNDVRRFNLSKLSTEIVAQLVPLALDKNIDIELKQEDGIHMMGNETSVSILIRNLVDNAIRYTPENGEVKVYVKQEHNYTTVRVVDSGPGIPPKLRARVFERFYRMLGTKASGSGLGLAIVQQIADLHYAHITLATPETGKGLEIKVTFPDMRYFCPYHPN